MEDIACIVGGTLLVLSGFVLSRLRPPNWFEAGDLPEEPHRWITRITAIQRGIRLLNNCLLALIGMGIFSAAFVPHGRSWILLWCVILALVMGCILLAMLDALSSLVGYRKALPEAARRSFAVQQQDPPT